MIPESILMSLDSLAIEHKGSCIIHNFILHNKQDYQEGKKKTKKQQHLITGHRGSTV